MIDTLTRVRSRILNPEHWTRGARARNAGGDPVTPDNPTATCWCLMGAIEREGGQDASIQLRAVLRDTALLLELPFIEPMVTNDMKGHAAAISLLDQTIARLICN